MQLYATYQGSLMLTDTVHSIVEKSWDIVVIGGGNAGVSAAITAAERSCSVLVIDIAPRDMRGGNTRHTRNLRAVHDAPTDVMTEGYSFEEYWDDLMRVTKGVTNEHLAEVALRGSEALPEWLRERGVRFQSALSGTLNLGRTNAFFLGGGRAMLNSMCQYAETIGVTFIYDADVSDIDMVDGFCNSIDVSWQGSHQMIKFKQLIAASGGFEADLDWLAEGWGDMAKNFLVRGTPYNKGRILRVLLDHGAQPVGALDQCHAVAIDARAPKYDGGIASRVDAVPFAIVLNKHGERFYDEGEDFWPKRYAIWGRLVAGQPDQIGYAIIDSDSVKRFMPSVFTPIIDNTIGGLADQLGLDPEKVKSTVDTFNAACPEGPIDQMVLDGKGTTGLEIDKTNWATPISSPPYYGFPLRPGITFTYMGVAVNDRAQVLMQDGKPAPNLFAAGEIMAGNVLGQGYLGGIGMTIGGVFGRIAGSEAARVLNR